MRERDKIRREDGQLPGQLTADRKLKNFSRRSMIVGTSVLSLGLVFVAGYANRHDLVRNSYSWLFPLTSEDYLKRTAEPLREEHRRNSFQEGLFSQDQFDYIQKGTFAIQIYQEEKKTGTPESRKESPVLTGWLARAETDGADTRLYIATARHALLRFGRETGLEFWRPGIDNQRFDAGSCQNKVAVNRDIALIRCQGAFTPRVAFQALNWIDDFNPRVGTDIMIVGFPRAFKNKGDRDYFTFSGRGPIEVVGGPQIKKDLLMDINWTAKILVGGGNSGSPVLINKRGIPTVVGNLWGGDILEGKAYINALNIGSLMASLDRRH